MLYFKFWFIEMFANTRAKQIKVFARLFQKAALIQRECVGCRAHAAKYPAAFSFVSFSFVPRVSKEKRKTIKDCLV